MAHTQDFAIGRAQRVIVTRQTSSQFDELTLPLKPTTSDNLSAEQAIISFSASYEQERKPRGDKRSTRSHQNMITAKKNVSWQLEQYLLPFTGNLDTTGSVPVYGSGPLLKMAFGSESRVDDTSVSYTLSDAQAGLDVATIHNKLGDVYMEALKSAWVEEWKLSVTGGDEPKMTFAGGAQDMVVTGYAEVDGNHLSTDTTIAIVTDEATSSIYSLENGSIITFGSENNGGAGYQISANGGTATVTIDAGLANGITDDDDITPFLPTGSTWPDECSFPTNQPLAGILGTLNIAVATPSTGYDETGVPIVAFEVSIKNNVKAVHNEAFRSTVRDIIPGYRDVTGSITVILTKEQAKRLAHRKNAGFVTNDIAVSFGGALAAAGTVTVNIDRAEIMFSEIEIPEAEEVTFTLPFKALASSAGADEISMVFY